MKLGGVIIAGGRSRRMGAEKALTPVAGRSLIEHVIARVGPQVSMLTINANGDPARFTRLGLKILPDLAESPQTPLAGLRVALRYAREAGFDSVLTVPSDTPFLPPDLVTKLKAGNAACAIASSGGQHHYLTGLWRSSLLEHLELRLETGLVRMQDWFAAAGGVAVVWPHEPYDPFFNVNTPGDLALAERIAAEFAP